MPQHSLHLTHRHRLQDRVIDMLSEYDTTIERLKDIKKQLDKFVDASESGKILRSIPGNWCD
jgi:transposase